MNNAIALTDTSSAAQPLIDMWFQEQVTIVDVENTGATQTLLTNPSALSFTIWAEQSTGYTQVLSHTVDLTADQVSDPLTGLPQPGHYAAAFSPAAFSPALPPGTRCEIRWVWTMPNGARGATMREFDVLATAPYQGARGYCLPSDLRDEGLSPEKCPDKRLVRLIAMQSAYIDRATGRFFEPRWMTQNLDGTGGRAILFGDPLIALQLVTLGNPVVNTINAASFRVFNRWISSRVTNPDDRNSPKIEFVHFKDIFGRQRSASIDSPLFGVPFRDLFFPAGVQNVNVTGLWGYTDYDGSPVGMTPDLIRHATKLLVMREVHRFSSDDRDERKRHRIVSEGTRDQRYQLTEAAESALTGDREIDDILLSFHRPIAICST